MTPEALVSWNAPLHLHTEKKSDWYWAVGIITLAIAVVSFMFGDIITGIFVIVAAVALVIHASHPPLVVRHEINDRGVMTDATLYPFVTLDSFWIPHDEVPPRILIRSRKMFMPLMVIYIDETEAHPEDVRAILLKYIAETEHHEPFMKRLLEWLGF